ncbi:PucR family transcriptional regulator [Planotetraspora kaengkrachanensis]|uniref:PucR family transcriptional regulator n=1 Tax=Planotetraspora kaengkrachanensis TaxID=575193 RepID=A0A8J3LV75_9ACTN|nr:PucR family transcriptional regulator [Planotetraspora kaengkrachanensis]
MANSDKLGFGGLVAPTLRRVTAITPLHLEVLAGHDTLDRPVRWVAVSELEDPTPFLEGGELVLTTGMRLTPDDAVPYISRLVARGATGLGFGVGLGHDLVPPSYVDAAAAAGLPLVEVPRDTPFIAIGKAVSELIAAEQYEEIRGAFAAQGRLTRAALQPSGTGAVIDRLAREISGWALLLDDAGAVRHFADATGTGPPAEEKAAALRPELARLRRTSSPASLALATPGEHVIVQPVGRRGFVVVGAVRAFSPIEHTVVNAAGSLLTLALEQGRDQRAAAGRVRAAVFRLLLAGQAEAAADVLAALGGTLSEGAVAVLACETADAEALAEALPCFTAPWGRVVVALAPAGDVEPLARRAAGHGRVGVGVPGAGLALGLDQAERALASADPVAYFAELAGQGLLALLDPGQATAFAAALLAPLREYGSRGDLVESLRAYLASNGHWDAAAQRLGIHRHTLRYRMKRVSELLGRDLDDPSARAELWIALRL